MTRSARNPMPTIWQDCFVDMMETEKYGYYHVTNEGGYIILVRFHKEIYRQAGISTEVQPPVTTAEYGLSKAARPFNSRLEKTDDLLSLSTLMLAGIHILVISRKIPNLRHSGEWKSVRASSVLKVQPSPDGLTQAFCLEKFIGEMLRHGAR